MKIYIIRHGKTTANEQKLYCGKTNLPLSEVGINEILTYKDSGIYPNAEAYFGSGLIRTNETISLIHGDVEIQNMNEISEYDFGDFEMKNYENLKSEIMYQLWINDTLGDVKCPNGESKNEFNERVISGYRKIIAKSASQDFSSIFICCHGGVIVNIMEYLFPGIKNFYEWQPEPGHGYIITVNQCETVFENI